METPAKITEEEFDIAIAFDGTWLHQGAPMTRLPLVRLFAGVLQRDASGDHWLITPVERGRIRVADAPFIVTGWRIDRRGADQTLYLTDNLGRETPVDATHPLTIRIPKGRAGSVFVPYHQLGGGIEARLNTAVYYDLIDLALEQGGPDETGRLAIISAGLRHPLGLTKGSQS